MSSLLSQMAPEEFSESEPLVPRNILFPIKNYHTPMTKMASLMSPKISELDENQQEFSSPKRPLFSSMKPEDSDYCLGYNSRCFDSRKVDFAQKYLFKKSDDDYEVGSECSDHSDESCHSDDEGDSLYCTQAQVVVEQPERKVGVNDMFFSCSDWNTSSHLKECKRNSKLFSKEYE